MKFILIHGAYGNPDNNWFPWLKRELEKPGHEVITPKFPTPENQSFESWKKVIDKVNTGVDSVFVGHSLGVPFILRLLEQRKARACFFVAGFADPIGIEKFDFDWNRIRKNCRHFVIFHSDNDPYVPLALGKAVADNLGVDIKIIKGAGHFNTETKWFEFRELLEEMNSTN